MKKRLEERARESREAREKSYEKVKTIMGYFLQMNTLKTGQAVEGGCNDLGQLDSSGESSEGERKVVVKSDVPDSDDDSNDVVLAFIASDEEYVDEWPATTRSGRAVTRRAEIDFSFF